MIGKMKSSVTLILFASICIYTNFSYAASQDPPEFFSAPYNEEYERGIEENIVKGIQNFLSDYTDKVLSDRELFWNRRFDSAESYVESVDPNRKRLKEIVGAIDDRTSVRLITEGNPNHGDIVGETPNSNIYRVRWSVLDGLTSEGLLLVPKNEVKATAVVIPDAGELPELYAGMENGSGLALRLAENGTMVLVPLLVNRDNRYSGSDKMTPRNPWMNVIEPASLWTNQTHREWIHRQGYVMGRHIIGLELQKIRAAIDWLISREGGGEGRPVGVMGYGEGGLLALYAAAIDRRINVGWVSGYFGPREELWSEPIYRNIWGLLKEFGDAEIASLIVPRSLIVESSEVPKVKEPQSAQEGELDTGMAGHLETPTIRAVESELERLYDFFPETGAVRPDVTWISDEQQHGSDQAFTAFAERLGIEAGHSSEAVRPRLENIQGTYDFQDRQRRVFTNMQGFLQSMIQPSDRKRYAFLQGDFSTPESWDRDMEPYREMFYEELIGKISEPLLPMNPRVRQIYDEPGWTGYEVVLDVWPGVYSWGILAVPKDIEEGENRPAVVMQHGASGLPSTPIIVDSYFGVLPALANRGFVVFSPYNPYNPTLRQHQVNIRKANAVKAGSFSIIIPQHQQILNYLDSLDYVDGERIALYGKSWGGRTAQKVPVVLKDYKIAISSAYFNDWVRKTVSTEFRNSYFTTRSKEVYKWNMGNTFTHAEMAAMIAPRPFMVESGYLDGVAAHEMVAYEFEKIRRLYTAMGIEDRIDIEFFMGRHDIHGVGTFRFLHKHLDWPAPKFPTETQQISK